MRRPALVLLAALAGCGGTDDPAKTATTPTATPPPVRDVGPWREAVAPAGRGVQMVDVPQAAGDLVVAEASRGGAYSCEDRDPVPALATPLSADGRLGPLRALPGDVVGEPVARPDGGVTVPLAVPLPGSTDCAARSRLELVDLDARGQVVDRTVVAPEVEELWRVALAGQGDARTVAWLEVKDDSTFTVRAAVRLRNGGLSRPRKVAERSGIAPQVPGISDVDLALAPDGTALVAYTELGRVSAATLRADGTVARRRTLARVPEPGTVLAAVGDRGRAVVAWSVQDGGEERNEPYRVFAAVKPAGTTGFRPAQELDPGGEVDETEGVLRLALAGDGRALVAWDNVEPGPNPVYVAQAPPDGRFGPRRRFAGARLLDADLTPDGRAVLALQRTTHGVDVLTSRVPGGPLRARGRAAAAHRVAWASAWLDADGRPRIVWSATRGRQAELGVSARRGP